MRARGVFALLLFASLAMFPVPLHGGEVQEAPLPHGARAMSGRSASLHQMALSADGKRAAIVTEEGALSLFDTETCKQIIAFDAIDASLYRVCFSIDGKKIYAACDGQVRELDAATGKELRAFAHEGQVGSVAATADGLKLAATDSKGVKIWNLKTGEISSQLIGHAVPEVPGFQGSALSIEGLAYSADGRVLLTEANDESARVWNTITGKTIRVLDHHDGSTAAVALSPDGAFGISTRGQGRLRLWEVGSGRYLRVIHAHSQDITCLSFSSDGRTILSGSHDCTLRQWDVETGIELRRFTLKSVPESLACGPLLSTAVTASNLEGLTTWDLNAPPSKLRGGEEPASADDAWKLLAMGTYEERSRGIRWFVDKKEEGAAELGRRIATLAPAAADVELQRQWIEKLNDSNYTVRSQAYDRLQELGGAARETLAENLHHPSIEVRTRVAALINAIGGGQDFRGIVALEALASMQSPAGNKELERVAALRVPLAAIAKAILERLK